MSITKDLILHVAQLARLRLTEEEVTQFTKDSEEILAAFAELDKVDTKGIKPEFQPLALKNHLREDTPGPTLSQKEALSLTKHQKDGYFLGPRVM